MTKVDPNISGYYKTVGFDLSIILSLIRREAKVTPDRSKFLERYIRPGSQARKAGNLFKPESSRPVKRAIAMGMEGQNHLD